MRIAKLVWQANISAEYSHLENPTFKKQLQEVLDRGIPYMIVFGTDELNQNIVKVKNMKAHTEVAIKIENLIEALIADNCQQIPVGADVGFLNALNGNKSA